jgi:hypothetical protein
MVDFVNVDGSFDDDIHALIIALCSPLPSIGIESALNHDKLKQ